VAVTQRRALKRVVKQHPVEMFLQSFGVRRCMWTELTWRSITLHVNIHAICSEWAYAAFCFAISYIAQLTDSRQL
jgi:hypothetical protein